MVINIKRVGIIVIVFILAVYCVTPVYAATYSKQDYGYIYGYYSGSLILTNRLTETYNTNALTATINSWNNAFSHCSPRYNLSLGNSNNIVTESSELENNVAGQYRVIKYSTNRTWRKCTNFNILIRKADIYTTRFDTLYGSSNWRKSTFAHELGHAMSLADLDDGIHKSGESTSIMSYNRNRKIIIEPSHADVLRALAFK